MCFSGNILAQEVLLQELFDDGTLGVFTAYSVTGPMQEWEARMFEGKQFAQMNGFDGGIQENEDWLISPALDMDQYSDEVLTFENASNFSGPDLELLVSTDYDGTGDPNTATWTDLSDQVTWSSSGYEYVDSGELDLSSFTGTGYIAFKYISNTAVDGKLWQVDGITVTAGTLSNVNDLQKERRLISTPRVIDGQLSFTVLAEQGEMSFALYTADGRFVQQFKHAGWAGTVSVAVTHLPAGVYVLQAMGESGARAYRFTR